MYMYHMFFIHSSIDRHLDCFCVLCIVNSTAVDIGVYISFWIMFFFFFLVYGWPLVLIIKCEFSKMRTKTVIHGKCFSLFGYSVFLLSLEKCISNCSLHHNHLDSFKISDCWTSTPVSLGWGWRIFISNRFSGIVNASGSGNNGKNEILGHHEMNVRQWQKSQGHNPVPNPDQFINKWFKHSNCPPEDLKSIH